MKKSFLTDCDAVLDAIYDADRDNPLSMVTQTQIKIHLLFCPSCSEKLSNLQHLEEIMKNDFFPVSPQFEESFMERLYNETAMERQSDTSAGFSFKSWVIIGFFMLLALSTSFFGINFIQIAASEGLSFLLPVGITIGMVLTCYGALFIGSHLKELSNRFRLH